MLYDASALLALLLDEPGAEVAGRHPADGQITTVNLAEVMSLLAHRGASQSDLEELLKDLPLDVVNFEMGDALQAALLRPLTKRLCLSLGDRACVGAARGRQVGVLTADSTWANLPTDLADSVTLIRQSSSDRLRHPQNFESDDLSYEKHQY